MKTITTNTIEQISQELASSISEETKKVLEVLHFNVKSLLKPLDNLSEDEKLSVIGNLINEQLLKLKSSCSVEDYQRIYHEVDNTTDYFTVPSEFYDAVVTEGDQIATDLFYKAVGYNDWSIELPINVVDIKTYCLSPNVKKEQFNETLLWIAMRYIGVLECLDYEKKHNSNKKGSKSSKVK